MVFNLFGVRWVMPLRVLDMLSSWQGWFECHRYKRIWEAVPHCLMWCLQQECNARSFEDRERTIPDLKLFFMNSLFNWLPSLGSLLFTSLLFQILLIIVIYIYDYDGLQYTPCIQCFSFSIEYVIYQLINKFGTKRRLLRINWLTYGRRWVHEKHTFMHHEQRTKVFISVNKKSHQSSSSK